MMRSRATVCCRNAAARSTDRVAPLAAARDKAPMASKTTAKTPQASDGTAYDIVIAGAGMAGATFALACAQAGLKCVLVDPQPFDTQTAPTFDGRASAIASASFRQWRVLGAGESLAPNPAPIDTILVTAGRTPGAAAIGDQDGVD